MKTIKIFNPESAIKLSKEQALFLGIDIDQDIIRAEIETFGPWQIIKSYKALCMTNKYDRSLGIMTKIESSEIFGYRKMTNVRQSGYGIEGYVSIKGKKYSCFDSSQVFDIEGKLIDVATIHARI